jgi:hypothetical protein
MCLLLLYSLVLTQLRITKLYGQDLPGGPFNYIEYICTITKIRGEERGMGVVRHYKLGRFFVVAIECSASIIVIADAVIASEDTSRVNGILDTE